MENEKKNRRFFKKNNQNSKEKFEINSFEMKTDPTIFIHRDRTHVPFHKSNIME